MRPQLLFAQGSLLEIEKIRYNVHLQIIGNSRVIKIGKTEQSLQCIAEAWPYCPSFCAFKRFIAFSIIIHLIPSRGGLEVERWSDNRTDSASVGLNPV